MPTVLPTRSAFLVALVGCGAPAIEAPAPPPVVPQVQLGGDWVIIEEDTSQVIVRWRDTADGVRINLAPGDAGRRIGVAPIVSGRTAALRLGDDMVPMVTPSFAPLTALHLEVQGPDLLVRMEGPPLATLTDHPAAPTDPALAWVRLRPRGETWRLALRGQLTVATPGEGVTVAERASDRIIETAWGPLEMRSTAPAWTGTHTAAAWTYDTGPSLRAHQPYPQVGITWTPTLVSP